MKHHLITTTTIGILALFSLTVHAQTTEQEQNQASQSPIPSNNPTTATTNLTDSSTNQQAHPHFVQEERERAQGWQRFWDFYRAPDSEVRKLVFTGSEQEYTNDYISLKWSAGKMNQSTSRTLSYQWLSTTEPATLVNLPDDNHGTIILRKNNHLLEFHYEPSTGIRWGNNAAPGTNVAINESIIRPAYYVASSVSAPLSSGTYDKAPNVVTFPVTKLLGIVVNDWVISMRDGVVYAQNPESGDPIRIGSNTGDNRPVGTMQIGIETLDEVTSAAHVYVKNSYYPHTLFATEQTSTLGKLITKHGGELAYKSELLNSFAESYGFKITWADQETRNLADTSVNKSLPPQSGNPQAVLHWIELILGEDYVAIPKSRDELYVGLSSKYHANNEFYQLANRLQTDYRMDTRLYTLKHIQATQAMPSIRRFLGCYFIGKPSPADLTTQTLKATGNYWAILRHPQHAEKKIRQSMTQQKIDSSNTVVCEDLNNTYSHSKDGAVVAVTATSDTHDEITEWLNGIEADVKQRRLPAVDEAKVPERRRLQVVLLQGGQAGEAAAGVDESGTSVTYQADVPPLFGMTPDDLTILGFDGAVVTGRGIIDLLSIPGEGGSASLTLGNHSSFSVQFQQEQGGFLVIEGTLQQTGSSSTPLAQNTMMLEKDKPTFLGVTNLSGAVIVVVTWINAG